MTLFDISEYKERITKTKERMSRDGIEVLLVGDPANMNYLTGYDGWSFYVPQLVILGITEEEPMWVGRHMDANGARITTWLKEENIRDYSDDYVDSSMKHPMDFVSNILKEKGWVKSVIGVDMDQYYTTPLSVTKLGEGLPNAVFKDTTLLVNMVRQIKSEKEIDCMKRAARITEKAMQAAIDSIEVGVRQCDVVANIYHAQMSATPEFGGSDTATRPGLVVTTEKGVVGHHLPWSDKKFQEDDDVFFEISGCYKRYHAPMCRTVYLGNPPDTLKEFAEVVVEGLNKTLDFVKPGVSCEEVEQAWRKAVAGSGIVREQRMGYSIGIGYPPSWGENTASLRRGDKTILEPNMTFHCLEVFLDEGYGFGISEALRVTASGCETLANFPRRLFVK